MKVSLSDIRLDCVLHSNKKSKSNDYRTFDINSKIESSKYDEELNGVEHLKKEPVLELS